MARLLLAIFALVAVMSGPAVAAEVVQLRAAGSLHGAMTDIIDALEAATGDKVQAKYGASGLLKDEIAAGAKAEVFASANMEHPQALTQAKRSGPAVMMNSIAFILGLLPLVVAEGAARISRRDVGTSVFAGMLAASTIGIFLIPMLYVVFQHLREWGHRRFAAARRHPSHQPPAAPGE